MHGVHHGAWYTMRHGVTPWLELGLGWFVFDQVEYTRNIRGIRSRGSRILGEEIAASLALQDRKFALTRAVPCDNRNGLPNHDISIYLTIFPKPIPTSVFKKRKVPEISETDHK